MEGRPWLRISLVILTFSLLGIPVWSMTGKKEMAPPVAPRKIETANQQLRVVVSFATPPSAFNIKHQGDVLCEGMAPDREFSHHWQSEVPPEGVDLLLKATWPSDEVKTAVRVEIWRDDDALIDETFWVEGQIVQAITIPGGRR